MKSSRSALTPIPERSWGIAAVTGAGAFMAMLDSTVVNLALESIREDLSTTLPLVQWIVTGYLCALAVSLPASAWLGMRYGYGRVWASSLAVFICASILCAVAINPATLISSRLLQGLAGGLMVPAGQAVIGANVAKEQLGRIFGLLGFVVALGPAIGPAVGGVLLDTMDWRWLFWINVPIGLAALAGARNLVPGGDQNSNRPLDVKGLMLLGTGLPLALFGASNMGFAELDSTSLIALVLGLLLSAAFIVNALRSNSPLIQLRLMHRMKFATATITTGLTGANMYGGLLIIPLYLQFVAGQGLVETGTWLLVMGLGSAIALPMAGMLTDRIGASLVSMTGALLLIVSTLPFLALATLSTASLGLLLVIRGVGLALTQMPAMTAAYVAVTTDEMGDASTLVNIIQRLGGAIGAVTVVIILQNTGGSRSMNAHYWVFATLAIIAVFTLFCTVMMQRSQSIK